MNQELTEHLKKPSPSKSAVLCLVAATAGPAYGLSKMGAFSSLVRANPEASEAELKVLLKPLFVNTSTVLVPILIIALVAGFINIFLVKRGGRKWTLMISLTGILISVSTLGILAFIWMNMGAK